MKKTCSLSKTFFIVVCAALIAAGVFALFAAHAEASAQETENLDVLSAQMTASDYFTYNGNRYSILQYRDSISDTAYTKYLFCDNLKYPLGTYEVSDDDPIVNIIPKQYFTAIGVKTYIGNEYGFFIETTAETYGDNLSTANLRSVVIVFDVDYSTDLEQNVDIAKVKVTNLFELEFITLNVSAGENFWRKTFAANDEYTHETGFSYNGDENFVVAPLFDLMSNAASNKFHINDISFAGSLKNAQNLNTDDAEYRVGNDYGSYFKEVGYYYNGAYFKNGGVEPEGAGEAIISIIKNALLIGVGIADPATGLVLSVGNAIIEAGGIIADSSSEKYYDATNDNCIATVNYTKRQDQIDHYGKLSKYAAAVINTDSSGSLIYREGDYARAEFGITDGEDSVHPLESARFSAEVALKIVDKDMNVVGIAHSSRNFTVREGSYNAALYGNGIFLLSRGVNRFTFTPTYSGKYEIAASFPSDVKFTFAGKTVQGKNINVSNQLTGGNTYDITAENLSDSRVVSSFYLQVSSDTALTVSDRGKTIARVDGSGFKKITADNGNIKLSLYDCNLTKIKSSGTNIIYAGLYVGSDARYNRAPYYIIAENTSTSDITVNCTITDETDTITETANKTVNVNGNEKFFRFTPSQTWDYTVMMFRSKGLTNTLAVYESDGKMIENDVYNDSKCLFASYRMSQGAVYYIGMENISSVGVAEFAVKQKDKLCDWYVDGNPVHGMLYLRQNQQFTLEVRVNNRVLDNCVYRYDQECLLSSSESFVVRSDAIIAQYGNYKIDVLDTNNVLYSTIKLYIVPDLQIKFNLDTGSQDPILYWSFNAKCEVKWRLKANFKSVPDFKDIVENVSNCSAFINKGKCIDTAYATYIVDPATVIKYKQVESGKTVDLRNSYPNQPNVFNKEVYLPPQTFNLMFAGGKGTSAEPYLISNEVQLRNMSYMLRNSKIVDCYKLINDFAITALHGSNLVALPVFSGVFEGNGQTLTISYISARNNCYGLFSEINGGSVNNLKITISNNNVSSKYGGLVCGKADNAIIKNCTARGTVSVSGLTNIFGGIVGELQGSSRVENCDSHIDIITYGITGGIVGNMSGGTVYNCSYYGRIYLKYIANTASGNNLPSIGGIAGKASGGTIKQNRLLGGLYYDGDEYKEANFTPCIGYIVGWKTGGCAVINNDYSNYISISTGKLLDQEGFLGIGRYKQLIYVSSYKDNNNRPCGRVS